MWFDLKGDARLGSCASEGCGGQPTSRLEAEGVGSNYCSGCRSKIEAEQGRRAIIMAAGMLQAANIAQNRSDQYRAGMVRNRSKVAAQALLILSDDLRDLAVKTRQKAAQGEYPP
jgi:hypothetical protein